MSEKQDLHNQKFPVSQEAHHTKPQLHHGSLPSEKPQFSSEDKGKAKTA